jgi:hypothetical protein
MEQILVSKTYSNKGVWKDLKIIMYLVFHACVKNMDQVGV